MYRWEITRAALAQRILATIRADSYDHAAGMADTLLSAGITTLEISLTTPFALEAVTTLVREVGDEAIIGAGTVLDGASARMAVDAGARFLTALNLDPEVISTGHRYGIPVFPGAATVNEIVRAMELGADAVMVFPASAVGPDWLADVRAVLPQAPMLPAAGITPQTAPRWLAAGAVACGLGAPLVEGDRETVAKRVADLLGRIAEPVE
ncbi:bifunctional 4-hydroxy-2-oxoglutarate aldolase/2-dehydro-3-deoxy-phosphogluconate aldolase [Streptantibioticus rubrisoli]|uniref:Bifunctional 4-hydroxy-2-oxoglutarate aldolase/2-dehydro-3-deoxy-phosphogluconate aldolase n=1 Tax=Streptantibioticus rubrisoli TaxID=1387313 RepID=A0ABT1PCN6_9ACTN|nr:bifunctional 4-hydroxy-2-oxoglutarate aldolase/2-dehydro-3-deoxy-phosphogluconate aldolase [Streptantibioticus rubrisoli]MCQ4043127.1 bifunctional 4-hydroxy-2-oxoglutarate aldolase/2-dehydro-3-deoxy-phosphogluconate aldolase [Streptantibioticus rubrisoli]